MSSMSCVIEMHVYCGWYWSEDVKEITWRCDISMWTYSHCAKIQFTFLLTLCVLHLDLFFMSCCFPHSPTLLFHSSRIYRGKELELSLTSFQPSFNDYAGTRVTWWTHLLRTHYCHESHRLFPNMCEVLWESKSWGPHPALPMRTAITKSYWILSKSLSNQSFSIKQNIFTPESQKYPANWTPPFIMYSHPLPPCPHNLSSTHHAGVILTKI